MGAVAGADIFALTPYAELCLFPVYQRSCGVGDRVFVGSGVAVLVGVCDGVTVGVGVVVGVAVLGYVDKVRCHLSVLTRISGLLVPLEKDNV